VPLALFEAMPTLVNFAQAAFALSGMLGLSAIICLAIYLWKTV